MINIAIILILTTPTFVTYGCPDMQPFWCYSDECFNQCIEKWERLGCWDLCVRKPPTTAHPTNRPTPRPTPHPTNRPTKYPTKRPTKYPTKRPTPPPTNRPTKYPTKYPTNRPTNKPTKQPTPSPTNNPSSRPTEQPSGVPTQAPTKNPTTPSPTTPDELFCGDSDTGAYSGVYLEFNVQMAYAADLMFDASQSDFNVTTIEAYSKLNVPLGQDTDHDEILTLFNYLPGDYKFIIDGGTQGGTYNIQITCTSKRPTNQPTSAPTTTSPTTSPTPAPTTSPTTTPTTLQPTTSPTTSPTTTPTPAPINQPTHVPIEQSAPTTYPTPSSSIIPTTIYTESTPSPYLTKTSTPLKSTTETIKTTETIEYGTLHSSFWEANSFTLILIGMVCGLFCIICCLFLLVILFVNNNYKRKNEEHTGIDESMKHMAIGENMKHTGIDDFFDGIDNNVMKQLPPKIVPNKTMMNDIWNANVFSEALPLQNNISPCSDNSDVESMYDSVHNKTQHMPLQNNISPCSDNSDVESMYDSVHNKTQHMLIDLKIIDQMNENYNDEEGI